MRRFVPPLLGGESRAPELLVALSLILAALSLADLLAAVAGGFTLVVGPAAGAAVGWIAHKKVPRGSSLFLPSA